MRILLTGGAGFIGSHLCKRLLADGHEVVLIDRLDISGNLNRLEPHPGMRFFYHDLRAPISDYLVGQIGKFDWILHLAAGTHVDRSIEYPLEFVYDNVVGTCNILDFARRDCTKFLYFSTDEVFGPAPDQVRYQEWSRYNSGNPYSAAKAGAEELTLAYGNTYGVPVIITHTMNVIGTHQHPEKYVPGTIRKVLFGDTVTVHSNKLRTQAGSRFYINAQHVADAVCFLMEKGRFQDKYNIVGEREMDNLELARRIADAVGKELKFEMVDFHSSRPGHDLRYALSGDKMQRMGWEPPDSIEDSIPRIVQWYIENPEWLNADRSSVLAATQTRTAA
jgi:dTDP-glucose 4,6-dehydratase